MDKKEETTMNIDGFLDEVRKMFPHGHPDFYKKMVEFCDLHNHKNRDYTGDSDDPMRNFRSVGHLVDVYDVLNWNVSTDIKVAVIYNLKQFDAYMNMFKSGTEGKVEGISERLGDVTVYTVLTDILYKEFNDRKNNELTNIVADNVGFGVNETLYDLSIIDEQLKDMGILFNVRDIIGEYTIFEFPNRTQEQMIEIRDKVLPNAEKPQH